MKTTRIAEGDIQTSTTRFTADDNVVISVTDQQGRKARIQVRVAVVTRYAGVSEQQVVYGYRLNAQGVPQFGLHDALVHKDVW